jgi:hypothetical protein
MERQSKNLLALASVAAIATALGCTDKLANSTLTEPVTAFSVAMVSPDPNLSDAAEISFAPATADSVRAHYASSDSSDVGVTPWFAASAGALTVLGLRPSTTYNVALEARGMGSPVMGTPTSYTTPALPSGLSGVGLSLVSGTPPTTGYTLTSISAPDGHGYLVVFDAAGAVRWYHDCGKIDVQEAKQQTNGDFTVYAGNAIGSNAASGAFIELKPNGDPVRSISAKGSPYTDGHELQIVSDANGNRIADYLFGYDIRSVDETAYGGGPADQLAGHQLLRINAAGAVDTLMQGWSYWAHDDKIDPPTADQSIDHPNSIDFDLDGGIIASFRNLGAIVKIDPNSKQVLWQMGGARNQFTFVGDPLNGFGGQHSVRVLPNGHFIVFDNGVTHTPQASRAVEYAVDESAKTATMVWQYVPSSPLFNEFTGSVQRLANGNTVVAWTNYGWIDEVGPTGVLVNRMQINSASGVVNNGAYRAIRIDNLYQYKQP